MPSCREIDPLFAPYVDGEATADERAIVDAHLRACPKCRHQTALQSAVRETVRAKLCRPCAPEELRTRCRAAASAREGTLRHDPLHVRIAFDGRRPAVSRGRRFAVRPHGPVTDRPRRTAHPRSRGVFRRARRGAPVDVGASEEQYERAYGADIRLPRAVIDGLQLVNMRRCFCGEGVAAHAMYRLHGRAVSLYVIPDANRGRASMDVFGHDAVMWSNGNATYVLVSKEPRETLEALARQMEGAL